MPPENVKWFLEFPTPQRLRQANSQYAVINEGRQLLQNPDGSLKPYPSTIRKKDIFVMEKFEHIDSHAKKVM